MFTEKELDWILTALTVMLDRAVTRGSASAENIKEVEQLIEKAELYRVQRHLHQ